MFVESEIWGGRVAAFREEYHGNRFRATISVHIGGALQVAEFRVNGDYRRSEWPGMGKKHA